MDPFHVEICPSFILVERRQVVISHELDLLPKELKHGFILEELLRRLDCLVEVVAGEGHLFVVVEEVIAHLVLAVHD